MGPDGPYGVDHEDHENLLALVPAARGRGWWSATVLTRHRVRKPVPGPRVDPTYTGDIYRDDVHAVSFPPPSTAVQAATVVDGVLGAVDRLREAGGEYCAGLRFDHDHLADMVDAAAPMLRTFADATSWSRNHQVLLADILLDIASDAAAVMVRTLCHQFPQPPGSGRCDHGDRPARSRPAGDTTPAAGTYVAMVARLVSVAVLGGWWIPDPASPADSGGVPPDTAVSVPELWDRAIDDVFDPQQSQPSWNRVLRQPTGVRVRDLSRQRARDAVRVTVTFAWQSTDRAEVGVGVEWDDLGQTVPLATYTCPWVPREPVPIVGAEVLWPACGALFLLSKDKHSWHHHPMPELLKDAP